MRAAGAQALSSIVGSLSLPSAAILDWLDSHVQVRLSILFAYMVGKSQLFAHLLTWLAQTWAPMRAALDPLFMVLGCVPAYHLGFLSLVYAQSLCVSKVRRSACW